MKTLLSLIAIIIVVIVVHEVSDRRVNTPEATPLASSASQTPKPNVSAILSPRRTTHTVTYTGTGYSPSTLTVRAGDAVLFQNNSRVQMWPESFVDDTHPAYPGQSACSGSTFDACNEIAPGQSWSFTFRIIGTWQYRDHLFRNVTGTVVVTE